MDQTISAEHMTLRGVFLNILLTVATLLLVGALFEGGTRLLDYAAPGPARSWEEFHLRKPPPYQYASYDIELMVKEGKRIKFTTSPDYGWLAEDHAGVYINIVNHERKTVATPARPERRIWVFGGSTIISGQVPDALTIPSLLQRELNAEGHAIEVRNLGATTVTTQHQLYKLANLTPVAAGDIVVFYDGANDVIQSLYFQNPTGTMVDANRRTLASLPWWQRAIWHLYDSLKDESAFVRRFLNPTKPTYYEVTITDALLQDFEDRSLAILKEADAFARSRSAMFAHFIQPTLYTVSRPTDYERALAENGWLYPKNLREVYAVGYPALRRASDRANAQGIVSKDFTSVLDAREREVFLDFCHVTEHANELIAKAMYAALRPALQRSARVQ